MPSIALDFIPPAEPDIITLRVWEAPAQDGPFALIESVSAVGEYPNYITRWVTDQATSPTDWFKIDWVDSKGAVYEISQAVQGGTVTLVGKIVQRVLARDSSLDERIVDEEAQAVVCDYFNVDDPALAPDPNPKELRGLTSMTMARVYISNLIAEGQSESYTAGLVSQRAETSTNKSLDLIKYLLGQANQDLGTSTTYIMLLEDVDPTGLNTRSTIDVDESRLIVEIQ